MIYWPARPLSRTTTTKLTPSHSHPAVSDLLVRRNILNHFLVGLSVNKNMTFQKISDSADDNPAPQQRVGPPINAGSAQTEIHSHQPPAPTPPRRASLPNKTVSQQAVRSANHARLPPCERLSARCHARQRLCQYALPTDSSCSLFFSRERIAYPSCRESSPGASSQGVPEPEDPGRVHRRHEARHAVYVPRQPYIRPLNRTMR